MPFKSEAQRRKFYAMTKRGEISPSTVKRWEKHTPKGKLPEKVKSKKEDVEIIASVLSDDITTNSGFLDSNVPEISMVSDPGQQEMPEMQGTLKGFESGEMTDQMVGQLNDEITIGNKSVSVNIGFDGISEEEIIPLFSEFMEKLNATLNSKQELKTEVPESDSELTQIEPPMPESEIASSSSPLQTQ